MRVRPMLVAALAATATATAFAAPAQAAPIPVIQNLNGPLSFSVSHGKIIVAQTRGGRLTRFNVDGSGGKDLFVRSPSISIGGVEAKGKGTLFTVTGKTAGGVHFAQLVHLKANGTKSVRGNMFGFEAANNPDHGTEYGFRDLSSSCAAKVPHSIGGKPYSGKVDSHPYGTAKLHSGSVLVADAGGNDVLKVTPGGTVSVVAVLPAQPKKVTKTIRTNLGLPKCTVHHKYYFEPVPTDVEARGHHAWVTTLPGGPEDASLGARGKVYRINLHNGAVKVVGKHLLGATGLAVSPTKKIYVAELFGNRISTFSDHVRETFLDISTPAAIEWHAGSLWVTSDSTSASGSIQRITP
jgi:hypothetical protein